MRLQNTFAAITHHLDPTQFSCPSRGCFDDLVSWPLAVACRSYCTVMLFYRRPWPLHSIQLRRHVSPPMSLTRSYSSDNTDVRSSCLNVGDWFITYDVYAADHAARSHNTNPRSIPI